MVKILPVLLAPQATLPQIETWASNGPATLAAVIVLLERDRNRLLELLRLEGYEPPARAPAKPKPKSQPR